MENYEKSALSAADRLELVLRKTKLNVKTLSEALGYDRPQGLYDVARGRTKAISADLANRIITAFPEFNRSWLITGDGDMLNESDTVQGDVVISAETWRVIRDLTATVKSQQEELRELRASTPALAQKKSAGL